MPPPPALTLRAAGYVDVDAGEIVRPGVVHVADGVMDWEYLLLTARRR